MIISKRQMQSIAEEIGEAIHRNINIMDELRGDFLRGKFTEKRLDLHRYVMVHFTGDMEVRSFFYARK